MSTRSKSRRPAPPPPPPKNNRTWVLLGGVVAVVVVTGLVALLFTGGGGGGGGGGKKGTPVEVAPVKVTGTPLATFPASGGTDKAIGSLIPTLNGKSLFDGSDMTVGPNGKPQLIAFVAHWCPHCQAEVPRIVALAKAGKLDGIDVSTVATGTRSDLPNYPPSTWLEGADWPYPTVADSARSTAAVAYGLTSYPYLVLVDAQGKVVARAVGEVPDDDIVAAVTALKAGKPVTFGSASSASAK